jgi:hypothetical protein
MKWYGKLLLSLGAALVLCCVGLMVYGVWFKYERNDYVDELSLKFAVAAETGELEATCDGVTTEIAPLNYNTILFYLTREPAFTLRKPAKDASCVDLLLGGTEHILVYSTDDPQITLVRAQVNGHVRYHRLTYRDLYRQLATAVSEKGFREPNRVLNTAN